LSYSSSAGWPQQNSERSRLLSKRSMTQVGSRLFVTEFPVSRGSVSQGIIGFLAGVVQKGQEPVAVAAGQLRHVALIDNLSGRLHKRGNGKVADGLARHGSRLLNYLLQRLRQAKIQSGTGFGD
jgi:hypothetical protein